MAASKTPLVDGKTFGDILRLTAERHGDRDAVVFPQLGILIG